MTKSIDKCFYQCINIEKNYRLPYSILLTDFEAKYILYLLRYNLTLALNISQ